MTQTLCIHIANVTGDMARTGLVDYAAILSRKQADAARIGTGRSVFLSNSAVRTLAVPASWPYVYNDAASYPDMAARFPQQEFAEYLNRCAASSSGESPVLVCHVGLRTGALIAPETLRRFPVVMISHEFELLSAPQRTYRLEQLRAAERILFTTQAERECALRAVAEQFGPPEAEFLRRRSTVYPVPSNIEPFAALAPPAQRARNVIVFSTLRERKGLSCLPDIARAMQDDSYFAGRAIYLAGSVLTKNGGEGLGILKDLLARCFTVRPQQLAGLSLEETMQLTHMLEGNRQLDARALSPAVVRILSDDFIERTLPLYLRLDVPQAEVSELLASNLYSLLPMPRGATLHSGTLAASLAHHMITLACRSKLDAVPPTLSGGGMYLLDKAHDALEVIRSHETVARANPAYEQSMIDRGDDYRASTSWSGLVRLMGNLAEEALHAFQARRAVPAARRGSSSPALL